MISEKIFLCNLWKYCYYWAYSDFLTKNNTLLIKSIGFLLKISLGLWWNGQDGSSVLRPDWLPWFYGN